MNNSKERECPINPNCQSIKPDGSCNGVCIPKIVQRAQKTDQRDGYSGTGDTISKLSRDSDDPSDRVH